MSRAKTKPAGGESLFEAVPAPQFAAPGKPNWRPMKTVKVQIEPAPENMLSVIARAASDPAIDATKARELFKLYYETEAKREFHEALLAIDLPAIDRDGRIPIQGGKALKFASFENVHKAIMPLLRQHGFRMSFQPMPSANGDGLVVECKLIRGLYEEKCVVPISTAPASRAMNSQQALGAAIKYASRYGVMYLLNLRSEAPEDRDTDGTEPISNITGAQAKKLLKAIDDCGIEPTRFMEKYKITAVHELPAKMLDEAMTACADYAKRRRETANAG
jgi:hypothetical protein